MKHNLALLSAALVHDVMVYDLAYKGHFMLTNDIRLTTGRKIAGPALTVLGEFTFNRMADYAEHARVIDSLAAFEPGHIEVLQPAYAGPVGTWGGFTASLARKHGCAGAVIDGYTRDIAQLRDMDFNVYCRGTNVINGFGSGWQIADYGVAVQMPGLLGTRVTVNTGDYVVGDEDGVVIVPAQLIDEVLAHSEKRLHRERELMAKLSDESMGPEQWKKTIFDW